MKQIREANAEWVSGMCFDGEVNGHNLLIDGSSEFGGADKGPRPKTLMLLALAGCTGMDVVSILGKMRVVFNHFSVYVSGELSEEEPHEFLNMHIVYSFKGEDMNVDKIKRAIELSQTKYCGVAAMYRKVFPITYEINVNGEVLI